MNRLPSAASHDDWLTHPFTANSISINDFSLNALLADRHTACPPRRGAPYSLFTPMHYERNYAYPLLVWLHDEGGSERELRKLMPHVSVRNYLGAAVRGVEPSRRGRGGYSWAASREAAALAAERVRDVIELASKRYNVHPQRIFVAGCGRGGTAALRLALAHPEWFAGAASLGGPMPQGHCPLARVNAARRLPLLLVSSRDSREYPPSQVAADLRLLYSAGFSLSLRQYPCAAELTTAMLSDMDRWLMQQICPETAAAPSS